MLVKLSNRFPVDGVKIKQNRKNLQTYSFQNLVQMTTLLYDMLLEIIVKFCQKYKIYECYNANFVQKPKLHRLNEAQWLRITNANPFFEPIFWVKKYVF